GNQKRSLELSREALTLHERANDTDGIARSESSIGGELTDIGDYPEALPHLERALTLYKGLYGDDHPTVANTLGMYANIYLNTKRGAEAVAIFRQAREIYRRAGLAGTPKGLLLRSNLAAALASIKRTDDAEAELVALLELRHDDPLGVAHLLINLGAN